ncbi:MAG: hypothetical protein IT452_23655 [Planctomycetia bacterium]|nr:hypothetical protein [Planctomycetia bacterium]
MSTIASAPNALNFNNGLGLLSGTLFSGAATSPLITISSTAGVTLTFDDYFECMSCDTDAATTTSFGLDQRFVEVVDSSGVTVISIQLVVDADGDGVVPFTSTSPLIDGACVETETHHTHTVDLSSLAPGDYRIRFRFNQVSEFDYTIFAVTPPFGEDDMGGWFVDDIQVNCPLPDVAAPTLPVQISPPSGATVISPVAFDWSDSTDTGPCGPSSVTYDLYIDNIATIPAPDVFVTGISASSSSQVLAAGDYLWAVRAVDASGNPSAFTTLSPFTVEVNLAPGAPDGLFVNESPNGAQQGDPGFVDPVVDETPVFSAVYRDPNVTPDTAIGLRFQVTDDPTFTTLLFDSGSVGISPPIPVDTRCPDLTINITLSRDRIYYWRIQYTDAGGLTGAFSLAQSFRIGDDFEFGVRNGSSHHGRRCWIATAAWSNESAPAVRNLQAWRTDSLEALAVGRVASRSYHVAGARLAPGFESSPVVRALTTGATSLPVQVVFACGLAIILLGLFRMSRTA